MSVLQGVDRHTPGRGQIASILARINGGISPFFTGMSIFCANSFSSSSTGSWVARLSARMHSTTHWACACVTNGYLSVLACNPLQSLSDPQ